MVHQGDEQNVEYLEDMEILAFARRLAKRTREILSQIEGGSMSLDQSLDEIFTHRLTRKRISSLAWSILVELQDYPELNLLLGCWLRIGVMCDDPMCISSFYRFLTSHSSLSMTQLRGLLTPRFGQTPDFFAWVGLSDAGEKRDKDAVVVIIDRFETDSMDDARYEFEKIAQKPISLCRIQNLAHIYSVLNSEFPWFSQVIDHIANQLTARAHGRSVFGFKPLILLGDPGIGKTRFVRRLAELSGVPWRLLPLAGKADNRDLAGTAKGWSNACPGLPLMVTKTELCANPILVLDEIDKAGGSAHNGRIHDTLIQLLEPSSASKMMDDFLQARVNYSYISWIATANDVSQIPAPLLSRFQVLRVEGPTSKDDYLGIIETTITEFARRHGIRKEFMLRAPKIFDGYPLNSDHIL